MSFININVNILSIAIDALFLLLPYAGWWILERVEPFHRGFFCGDESIRYPFKSSTITEAVLYGVGFGVPIIIIFGIEAVQCFYIQVKTGKKAERQYKICNKVSVHPYVEQLYRYCGIFLLGAGINCFLTDIGKFTVGRMRPHFIAVCDPQWPTSNLSCSSQSFSYIQDYVCQGDKGLIRQARLSFPSGHSSFSFYSAVFSIIYLECRGRFYMISHISRTTLEVILIAAAFYTALSRISDYKHHWSDVLAGGILGCIVAAVVAIHVARLVRQAKLVNQSIGLELVSVTDSVSTVENGDLRLVVTGDNKCVKRPIKFSGQLYAT